jgi:molecular chaperone GrpE (heat shock protein)
LRNPRYILRLISSRKTRITMTKKQQTANTTETTEATMPVASKPEAAPPETAKPKATTPAPAEPELVSAEEAFRRRAEAVAPKFETPRERCERELRESVQKANKKFEAECWKAANAGDIRIKV